MEVRGVSRQGLDVGGSGRSLPGHACPQDISDDSGKERPSVLLSMMIGLNTLRFCHLQHWVHEETGASRSLAPSR